MGLVVVPLPKQARHELLDFPHIVRNDSSRMANDAIYRTQRPQQAGAQSGDPHRDRSGHKYRGFEEEHRG